MQKFIDMVLIFGIVFGVFILGKIIMPDRLYVDVDTVNKISQHCDGNSVVLLELIGDHFQVHSKPSEYKITCSDMVTRSGKYLVEGE